MSLSISNETSCEQAEAFSQICWIIFNFLWLLWHSINFPMRNVLQTIGRLHYWLLLFSYGSDDITAQPSEKHLEWIDISLLEIANLCDGRKPDFGFLRHGILVTTSSDNVQHLCEIIFHLISFWTTPLKIILHIDCAFIGLCCRHFILMHCQRRRLIIESEHGGITHRGTNSAKCSAVNEVTFVRCQWSVTCTSIEVVSESTEAEVNNRLVSRGEKFHRRMTQPWNDPPAAFITRQHYN